MAVLETNIFFHVLGFFLYFVTFCIYIFFHSCFCFQNYVLDCEEYQSISFFEMVRERAENVKLLHFFSD